MAYKCIEDLAMFTGCPVYMMACIYLYTVVLTPYIMVDEHTGRIQQHIVPLNNSL